MPEVEEHIHDATCYDAEGHIICGKREIKEHREHTEECYTTNEAGERVLTCTYPIAIRHQHAMACYDQVEAVLICGKEEHVHTDSCYEQIEEEPVQEEATEEAPAETIAEEEIQPETTPEEIDEEQKPAEETITEDIPEEETETEVTEIPADSAEEPAEEVPTETVEENTKETITEETPAETVPEVKEEPVETVPASEETITEENTEETPAETNSEEKEKPTEEVQPETVSEANTEVPAEVQEETEQQESETEENTESAPTVIEEETDKPAETVTETSEENKEEEVTEEKETEEPSEEKKDEELTEDVKSEEEQTEDKKDTEDKKEEETEEAPQMPAVSFENADTDVVVTVIAEEGSFPAGTTMKVVPVAAEEVTDAVQSTTEKSVVEIQAVDISFWNGEEEIEPLKPINVVMKPKAVTAEADHTAVVHVKDEGETEVVVEETEGVQEEVTFDTPEFSVYAIVYTVDFHYEVNGNTYDYSIPGGGFVSFAHIVEALRIAESAQMDTSESTSEDVAANNDNAVNETVSADTADQIDQAIQLNNIAVSEETKKFVAEVENVEFSNPELVWVYKNKQEGTVGQLKENNNLEVKYSSQLTTEQISEINAQTVEAGDWALISLRPFTSEETLTVTMKHGEQFVIQVTDAQISTHVITADGQDYVITVTYESEAGIPDDAKLEAVEIPAGSAEYENYVNQAIDAIRGDDEIDFLKHSIAYARFFDISIMVNGSKIEPAAPVSVTIEYAGRVSDDLQDMNVVHFAQSGVEVLPAETGIDENHTMVSFEQSSFSVTGTIVDRVNINNGDYYIVHYDNRGQKWYALASDGTYVEVTDYYDSASSSISGYEGSKNISWEVSASGNGYVIKAKDENRYISLANSNVIGNNPVALNLHSGSTGSRNTWITIDNTYTNYYWTWTSGGYVPIETTYRDHALDWNNGYTASSSSSYESWGYTYYWDATATDVQFARLSDNSEVVNDDWPNNTYNEQQIQAWLEQALNDQPLKDVEKIGYVYDYDNRIYEIELSAKSGVLALANDLSLAFVTDVSNSMLFPSKLTPVSGKTNVQMKSSSFEGLSTSKVYFTIGDTSKSSTVYALYYSNGWKAMDASYYARWKAGVNVDLTDREKSIGSSAVTLHKNDSSSTRYTIYTGNDSYFAGIASGNIYDMRLGDMGNRLYYLETSVNNAVSDMKSISATYPLGGVYAGLETFAKEIQNTQTYLKIGGYDSTDMAAANATYNANYNTLYNKLSSIVGADGTNQLKALNGVTNMGTLPAGTDKYVVLITDGAPNVDGVNPDTVAAAAKTLKDDGYKVITVGLSVKDVGMAPELLWRAASFVDDSVPVDSTDKSKAKYYYYAESGDDLTWILREIVRSIMKEATVSANITDEINRLFYPVNKDGTPLTSGQWINLKGEKVNAGASDAAGQVTYNSASDTWTVTWNNQETPWDGWHGTVYVKAKEDFMGGNNVSTNTQASFIPESYSVTGSQGLKTANFSDSVKAEKTAHPATPYVNVDELHMTQNETAWTVYLGTIVNPKEQLEKLWDDIKINTVVDTNGMNENYTIKSKEAMYYDANYPGGAEDKPSPTEGITTIPLSHYIDSDVLTDVTEGLLKQLKDGYKNSTAKKEHIPYTVDGQGEVGFFNVVLKKKVNEEAKTSAPEEHVTEKVSVYDAVEDTFTPVEEYTLEITYWPYTERDRRQALIDAGKIQASDDNYQHHGGREMEKEAAESISTNKHALNVFAKRLEIEKVDQAHQVITDNEATFGLYRKATQEESNDSSIEKKLLEGIGDCILVNILVTENGVITTDPLKLLKGTENYDESYYLVEEEAPEGYLKLADILKVTIDMSEIDPLDKNIWTKVKDNTTSNMKPDPYVLSNWQQDVKIKVTNIDGTPNTSAVLKTPRVAYDHKNDTTDASVSYIIVNSAGVELPHTGGRGTQAYTLSGLIMILSAGWLMYRRRRWS